MQKSKVLDSVFCAIVAALVIFPPFALGAVHPWPAAIVEILAFILVILWAVRMASLRAYRELRPPRIGYLVIPVLLLGALFTFQLLPLPPRVIRGVSPSTYDLYARSPEGWPAAAPYTERDFAEDEQVRVTTPAPWRELPSVDGARHGSAAPLVPADSQTKAALIITSSGRAAAVYLHSIGASRSLFAVPPTWYPLSLSPSLTTTAIVRFAAYAELFFAVAAYPFVNGSLGEQHLRRVILWAALVTGLLVASAGLLERVYWNGKILWMFVPWDWGTPLRGTLPRASGPFVDSDHFANYLAMIFPLALSGAFGGLPLGPRIPKGLARLIAGTTAFVLLVAILLSFSRAAWIETAAGSMIILIFIGHQKAQAKRAELSNAQPAPLRSAHTRRNYNVGRLLGLNARLVASARNARPVAGLLVVIPVAVGLMLLLAGPQGRMEAGSRLQAPGSRLRQGLAGGGIGIRPSVWKATVHMFFDFPATGVGLASWPEIYPHYAAPPWNAYYFREAHNDYLQFLSEAGLIGTSLVIWLFGAMALAIYASLKDARIGDRPLIVALVAAVMVMICHELVDFCLHVPANAVLLTLLLAIAVRIGGSAEFGKNRDLRYSQGPRVIASLLGVASLFFIALALTLKGLAYPYDIAMASTPAAARATILKHPGSASAHMALLDAAGPNLAPRKQADEIAAGMARPS